MKKKLIAVIALIAVCGVFALGIHLGKSSAIDEDSLQTNIVTESITAEKITEDMTETSVDENNNFENDEFEVTYLSDEELRTLIEENIYCNMIYNLKNLPTKEEIDYESEKYLYETDSEKFPDYASFESYIRSVYCKAEADRLLYDCPYEGMPMYTESDGKLCIDSRYLGSKGYYVDWTDFSFSINSSDNDRVSFTLFGKAEYPSDEPVIEEYSVSGAVVYENGSWRLEEMLY